MQVNKVCNLMNVQEFKSKDGSKLFHHASFVADDIVIKCQFIKQSDYNLLFPMERLSEVDCLFDVTQAGTDNNGNPTYTFRLAQVSVFAPAPKTPFKGK